MAGICDGWLIKLNSSGDSLWTKVFGGSSADSPMDVVADNKGGCIVVGITYSDDGSFISTGHHGDNTQPDGFVAFFDKDGEISKIKQFGSKSWTATLEDGTEFQIGGSEGLYSVIETSDGNYMAVGYSNSTDGDLVPLDDTQFWTGWFLKFDPNGKN